MLLPLSPASLNKKKFIQIPFPKNLKTTKQFRILYYTTTKKKKKKILPFFPDKLSTEL